LTNDKSGLAIGLSQLTTCFIPTLVGIFIFLSTKPPGIKQRFAAFQALLFVA
jgi:hypothetical protein